MEYHELNASLLAEKLDIGRSTISHLLSGRNKPSLDFVMKVLSVFPTVDLFWLLNGQGTFPKKEDTARLKNVENENLDSDVGKLNHSTDTLFRVSDSNFAEKQNNDLQSQIRDSTKRQLPTSIKVIERMVIFYDDKTFETYLPNS